MTAQSLRPDPLEIPNGVRTKIPLWPRTSIRAGGAARFFASPSTSDEVCALLAWSERNGLATALLGGGTNTIFLDAGFDGLVLDTTQLRGLDEQNGRLTAAAGEPLSSVVDLACDRGYTGMEWAAGIPGTVGGAAAMNAGTREGDMASVVDGLQVAGPGGLRWIDATDLGYAYRTSALKEGRLTGVIVEARLRLRPAMEESAACSERVAEIRRARAQRLPVGATFGSIFRNPPSGPTAGELLDRVGCKEMSVGAVRVSSIHANILVNEGTGNASEILELIRRMKDRVRKHFGIILQEEVVVVVSPARDGDD